MAKHTAHLKKHGLVAQVRDGKLTVGPQASLTDDLRGYILGVGLLPSLLEIPRPNPLIQLGGESSHQLTRYLPAIPARERRTF